MNKEDLIYIFSKQLDNPDKLFFMTTENDVNIIHRHDKNDIESLLPMLDNFVYTGIKNQIPRFVKL